MIVYIYIEVGVFWPGKTFRLNHPTGKIERVIKWGGTRGALVNPKYGFGEGCELIKEIAVSNCHHYLERL